MLRDAFPAEVIPAGRTADNRFTISMDQASLKSQVHLSLASGCRCAALRIPNQWHDGLHS